MKILIEKDSVIPVTKYGGTQRVIWYLAYELSKMGHEVSFLVPKGSYCDFARIIEIDPSKPIPDQIPEDIDVVHFNSFVPDEYPKPYIYSLHGNLSLGQSAPLNTVFVSRNHAERHGSNSYVYNGLDWNDYGKANLSRQRNLYHFLGKAAWRAKNIKGAIDIVKSIPGGKLEVLGGTRLNIKMGFRLTLSPKIRFKGMVDNSGKKEIIEQSKGLIFPVKWHEPFGLAVTESLYYGSPVYGTPYGSLPELVNSEVGFLSDKRSDIVEHILKCGDSYSPQRCHEYACDLFNSKIMAEEYLKKYERVLNGQNLNRTRPTASESYRDLPWIS